MPIKVMLVDDSVVARSIFERILLETGEAEIVCQAENSKAALDCLNQYHVDIILLDIEMPLRSGLEALPEIIAHSDGARILVVSSFAEENGPAAVKALSLGACDTLAKPGRSGFSGHFSAILAEKVVRLGRLEQSKHKSKMVSKGANVKFNLEEPSCIAIGASTGGISVIFEVIRSLDPALECPLFITQHLPDAFMTFFAGQLAAHTSRTVRVAERGVEVKSNHVYIAPGNAHLICCKSGTKIYIDHLEKYSGSRYCPSVDAMFESIATVYGQSALAIVLSGMGNDGVQGARLLSKMQAQIVVQDEESSVVWGMPGAIAREQLASAMLSGDEIALMLSKSNK